METVKLSPKFQIVIPKHMRGFLKDINVHFKRDEDKQIENDIENLQPVESEKETTDKNYDCSG